MQNDTKWSISRKAIFYFCFLFFGLNIFPFPINTLPFLDFFYNPIDELLWNPIIQLFGRIFFDIKEITSRPNGSGDTTWNWIQQFSILVIAAFSTIVWFFVAKNRKNHEKLNYWFIVLLRYYLGYTMLFYGVVKVFPLQFGTMTTYRLYERLGEMSPMGLLWTFMAYSEGYQFFGGMAEIIAGSLLFFRRTTTFGALLSIGVLANIFALNVFYDVPVKIYSFWLMLIGIYLALDDAKRLWNFLVMNRATEPKNIADFSDKKWFKISTISVKYLFLIGIFGPMFYEYWENAKYVNMPKTAIYGPYQVEKFEKNNIVSESDTLRWQEFFVDRRGARNIIFVTNQNGLRKRVDFRNDVKNHQLFMTDYTSTTDTVKYAFSYIQADSSSLYLKGKIKTDSFKVSLKKMLRKDFLLNKRGFHWINEVPFNK
jgi:hypothetical protein